MLSRLFFGNKLMINFYHKAITDIIVKVKLLFLKWLIPFFLLWNYFQALIIMGSYP